MTRGIRLRSPNREAQKVAQGRRFHVSVGDIDIPYDETLIVGPGAAIPWNMLAAGFGFLQKWDAASPLLHYRAMANELGTSEERKRTEKVLHDLRMLVYGSEILFVRKNEAGQALIDTWKEESGGPADPRLAFLRALYRVKPRFLALPQGWLSPSAAEEVARRHPEAHETERRSALVWVEIGPGQFIKCFPGEEEKMLQRIQRRRSRQGEGGK